MRWAIDMTATPPKNPQPLPSLALLAGLVFAIGAITAVFVLGRTKHDPFQSKESSPAAPGNLDKDNQFLWRLSVQGLQLERSNAAAVSDARHVCGRFLGGESKDQIIQNILQGSPGMSIDTATDFAGTAIDVYCPDGHPDEPG
jgi:hypothetical protein